MNIEGSISILDMVSFCWSCTTGHTNYISKLEENLDALRTEWEELKRIRNDVKRRVDIAEGKQMKRRDQVEGWLLKVEGMEAEVDELIRDGSQEIEKNCLGGCCPKNCKTSYKLGKKVASKLKQVAALTSKGVFEVVADNLPLASVDERPSEPTVGLESTFDEVWSCIEDEEVGIIGLYGIGGVGKTTLLTKINNKLCNTTHCFNVVIWVTVSQNPNPTKVQDDIGKKIGFDDDVWKNKSLEEKTIDIFRVLKEKKFVLLLDDIWERFDLSKVGVPLPNKQNKSKVVFTTRFEDVCGRMEARKKIGVKCLPWEEAWDLFQKKLEEDTLNADPEIPKLAKTVARECKGLPLALITIGRAMACKKTIQQWRYAGQVLQKFAADFSGMGDGVFPLLKFSYDSLWSDTVRSCFLYCSLYPEDDWISKEELIEYWFGEGLLDEFDDFNGAQIQGHDIIGTLIHACLLEEDSSDEVKMHDVIRDMALWIACECGTVKDKFLVQVGVGLKKAPEVGKWKGVERMSLMHNHIEELTETPSFPNLSTLLLNENNLKMITRGFFQNMPNLRVLDLSYSTHLDELPATISELVSLQYLNLSFTNIRELPTEFKNLVELKYLNLDYTCSLDVIPRGVLSSFKKLQVLKMLGCDSLDLLVEDSLLTGGLETLVDELKGLKDLNHLRLTIKTASTLAHILSFPKLPSCIRRLSLELFRGSKYMSFLESMRCLDYLQIGDCTDLEDLVVERAGDGMENSEIISHPRFHSLRSVDIFNCPKLKELTWLIFTPNLEKVQIRQCYIMEEVIRGGKWGEAVEEEGYLNLFSKLKDLSLRHLPQLKSIYPNALSFPCLKSIHVVRCPNLKKLPLNSDSAKGCGAVIIGDEDWWDELEWEDEATQNAFLPSFKTTNDFIKSLKSSSSSLTPSRLEWEYEATQNDFLPYFRSMNDSEDSLQSSPSFLTPSQLEWEYEATQNDFLPSFRSMNDSEDSLQSSPSSLTSSPLIDVHRLFNTSDQLPLVDNL